MQMQPDSEFHWYLLRTFATYELRCLRAIDGMLPIWGFEDRVKELYVPLREVCILLTD